MMAEQIHFPEIRLSTLLADICNVNDGDDRVIMDITADSRKVKTGDLFIACQGETVNAAKFIDTAIENGAVAVVWEVQKGTQAISVTSKHAANGTKIPVLAVNELSEKTGLIAHRFFGQPSNKLSVTAVTGTNGKTSVTQYLAQALKIDAPCGAVGTLGYGLYPEMKASTHTTPDVITLHRWLAELLAAGAKNVAIEVSSHALVQGRANNVKLHCGVFTNLTRDHLDYHGDMENYAKAKASLFSTPDLQYAVINIDDEAGQAIVNQLPAGPVLWRYGFDASQQAEVSGNNLRLDRDGISFDVTTPQGDGHVQSKLLGAFNASNLLAVLSVLLIHEVPLQDALTRLSGILAVSGRMERLGGMDKPVVVIDYAHTPDALQQALISLRKHVEGRLWCVFGCGGNRDKGKRPLMGEIAERYADYVVLTNDNPRNEDPLDIIMDIQQGLKNPGGVYVEPDRHKAIACALQHCHVNDVVLLAGKGHEAWQHIGNKKLPFSDVTEARQQLEMWHA